MQLAHPASAARGRTGRDVTWLDVRGWARYSSLSPDAIHAIIDQKQNMVRMPGLTTPYVRFGSTIAHIGFVLFAGGHREADGDCGCGAKSSGLYKVRVDKFRMWDIS